MLTPYQLNNIKQKLLTFSHDLNELAIKGDIPETWLIRFDEELIKAIDALDTLLFLSKQN